MSTSPRLDVLHAACQAHFTRFPTPLPAVSEQDIPWERDLFLTQPALLTVAWDPAPADRPRWPRRSPTGRRNALFRRSAAFVW